MNAFHFGQRVDRNDDQFTDMPLQDRVSLFNTWSVDRESDRVMTLGGRYIYEDRFGGDMNWVEADIAEVLSVTVKASTPTGGKRLARTSCPPPSA